MRGLHGIEVGRLWLGEAGPLLDRMWLIVDKNPKNCPAKNNVLFGNNCVELANLKVQIIYAPDVGNSLAAGLDNEFRMPKILRI